MHPATAQRSEPSVQLPLTLRRLIPQAPAGSSVIGLAQHIERDRCFVALLRDLRETGGLMRGDEVAGLMLQRGAGDVARLARWVVTRQVLSLDWRGDWWIPMFQFNLADMRLKNETGEVAGELAPAFDNWALAQWFATPNAWLHDRMPASVLGDDFDGVLQAARADRFVAMG